MIMKRKEKIIKTFAFYFGPIPSHTPFMDGLLQYMRDDTRSKWKFFYDYYKKCICVTEEGKSFVMTICVVQV